MKNGQYLLAKICRWGMMGALVCLGRVLPVTADEGQDNLTLRYNRPAEYFEEALVIGNGTLGAVVYGGTDKDRDFTERPNVVDG